MKLLIYINIAITVFFSSVIAYQQSHIDTLYSRLEYYNNSYNRKLEIVIDGNNAVTDALEERIGSLEHDVEDLQFMRGKK